MLFCLERNNFWLWLSLAKKKILSIIKTNFIIFSLIFLCCSKGSQILLCYMGEANIVIKKEIFFFYKREITHLSKKKKTSVCYSLQIGADFCLHWTTRFFTKKGENYRVKLAHKKKFSWLFLWFWNT
jgi:hypothetical protein